MKETYYLRKLMESMDEDEDENGWSVPNGNPVLEIVNTLALVFFDKYDESPGFNHEFEDMLYAFEVAIDGLLQIFNLDSDLLTMDQVDALSDQQLEKMVDTMWQIEHGARPGKSIH